MGLGSVTSSSTDPNPMYKVLPFSSANTPPAMLQEILNGLDSEGWELVQIVNYEVGVFLAILTDENKKRHAQSFGPAPMND